MGGPLTMRRVRLHALALAGYLLVTLAFTWPLARHLTTHLPGDPGGDTGVYVWNQWVFRHELLTYGRFPFVTTTIFSLGTPADLSLHNYTLFADLVALGLQPLLGVVGTFNAIYLLLTVLTAYSMFLLAAAVVGHVGAAWWAGLLVAWSAPLVARGTAHVSLVAAAPLPLFLLLLLRVYRTASLWAAAAAGVTVAWAATCDPYYAIYCFLIAGIALAAAVVRIRTLATTRTRRRAALAHLLEAGAAASGALALVIGMTGGAQLALGRVRVSATTVYTPMLLCTAFVLARAVLAWRPRLVILPSLTRRGWRWTAAVALAFALAATLPLSPVLYALGRRVADERFVTPPVFWRSSPAGIDLIALLLPNPSHPVVGGPSAAWLARHAGPLGVPESVGSLPYVALLVIAWAWWRHGWRPPRLWAVLTGSFATIALGPFVTIGGVTTGVPTPWTLLRYAPLVNQARAPGRALVVALVGLAVVAALALRHLVDRGPRRLSLVAAVIGVTLVELCPAPRPLYPATVPALYALIAADPRDVRVLELPTGVRDGLSSTGDFSALAQYYQTVHGKPLVGGYLSRVSRRRVAAFRALPVLDALVTLSEGRTLTPAQQTQAYLGRAHFLARSRLGYVVIDRRRASPELVRFAVELLDLRRIAGDERRDLYVPAAR